MEKRFISLSRKLAKELDVTCPLAVTIPIDDHNRYLSVSGTLLNGPQVLKIMLDSLEYDDNLAGARSAQDLMAIDWLGDKPHQTTRFLKIFLSVAGSLKDAQFFKRG